MPPLMLYLVLLLAPLLALVIYAQVLFHRLLRKEYEQFREVWEMDGKPYFKGCPLCALTNCPRPSMSTGLFRSLLKILGWLLAWGRFCLATQCAMIRSCWACNRVMLVWLLWTPTWIASSPALVSMLRRCRVAVLVWNIGVLVWFGLLLSVFFWESPG